MITKETTNLLNPLEFVASRILADFISSGESEYIIIPDKEIPLSPWYNQQCVGCCCCADYIPNNEHCHCMYSCFYKKDCNAFNLCWWFYPCLNNPWNIANGETQAHCLNSTGRWWCCCLCGFWLCDYKVCWDILSIYLWNLCIGWWQCKCWKAKVCFCKSYSIKLADFPELYTSLRKSTQIEVSYSNRDIIKLRRIG